ncbi:triose-phosphate isomerase [Limibacillus halophilus]|jgi:triosephosphate isomerase
MAMRRKLIAGNWKMNGLLADGVELARDLSNRAAGETLGCDLLVCPPATLLLSVGGVLSSGPVSLGGQDCHTAASGAHTGDISAAMLADIGCRYVIVGHSERRSDHGEDDALVRAKAQAALAAGLIPIVCVGESLEQREAGDALSVVAGQVRGSLPESGAVVIAYEPVWAIGTGRSATPQDAAEVHAEIRRVLGEMRGEEEAARTLILYGGSVKPGNAAELLALEDIDGALVGGASLKAEDFWGIARACP